METYYGTKRILAVPMTRGDYDAYRGWTPPPDEDPADEGFLVEYTDGGQPNHPDHDGYISWSPAAVFAAAYQQTDAMNFSHALAAVKEGFKVSRPGWNLPGGYLALSAAGEFRLFFTNPAGQLAEMPGWSATQPDLAAEDWLIVQDGEA